MTRIFLDSISTTVPDPAVVELTASSLGELWADPAAIHGPGKEAKAALGAARDQIASLLGINPDDLILTSGATEANATVLGTLVTPGTRIITSTVEPAGLASALAVSGAEVVPIGVDETGNPDPEALSKALEEDAAMVSLTHGHPVIGGTLRIEHLGRICRKSGVPLHVDARQLVGWAPLALAEMPIDYLSFSAHHFHGPPGVGGLYVRPGADLKPLIPGGLQERGRRAGREAVPLVVGMGRAAELAEEHLSQATDQVDRVTMDLLARLEAEVEATMLVGPTEDRLPGHLALGFAGVEGTVLANALDAKGIQVAPVPQGADTVLARLGVDEVDAISVIRLRISRLTTTAEIKTFTKEVIDSIERIREASPFW